MRPDEPISRIMTEAVVVIEADRPVSEVLDCFFQYPIHHLPVVRDGRLAGMLPEIGPDVVGGVYCPFDGHANSLKLLRALHAGMQHHGAVYRGGCAVQAIEFVLPEPAECWIKYLSPGPSRRAAMR